MTKAERLRQEVIDAARAGVGVGRHGVDWFNRQLDRHRLADALKALDEMVECPHSDCGLPGSTCGHPEAPIEPPPSRVTAPVSDGLPTLATSWRGLR